MPTYTQNVPQANQQIATTQPIINANFTYLQSAIGQEHHFNTADPAETYHTKASMPNLVDPISVPSGTDGMYYVKDALPKFQSGATSLFIPANQLRQVMLTGSVVLNASSLTSVVTLPANSVGSYWIIGTSTSACAMGQFVTDGADIAVGAVLDPDIFISSNTSALTMRALGTAGTYKYVVIYYTP